MQSPTPISAGGVGPSKPFVPDLALDHLAMEQPATDPTRDPWLEAAFLEDVVNTAQRLTGITNHVYPQLVRDRLAIGYRRYGAGDFLRKDNLREVREETPDIASYAILELTKQKRAGMPELPFLELRLELVACAAYGAVADYYAQRAARHLAEVTR